jgi:hypothetical protein
MEMPVSSQAISLGMGLVVKLTTETTEITELNELYELYLFAI